MSDCLAIPKKRKGRRLYDGSDGVSYGRRSGISGVRIARPFIHPLDLVGNPEAAALMKRPRFETIKCAQFPAYMEQARRDMAARRAALPVSLQRALVDNDNVVNDGDDWNTASEDDGECDIITNNLHGKHQDAGIRIRVSDGRTRAQRKIHHTFNFNAILGPCTAAYIAHKHHMAPPRSEPPPGACPSSSVNGQSPSVFTVDAIDMQSYYPKKEFQLLDDIVNVSLIQQGYIGCTPVRPHLAVATNVYDFYSAAREVHPSFSIEAFTRALCLVHKRPYQPGIRNQIASGWEAYLSITREVQRQLDVGVKDLAHDEMQ